MTDTPKTLTLTSSQWQRFSNTGLVTHLVVMEPPERTTINGKEHWKYERKGGTVYTTSDSTFAKYNAPFRPGDVVRVVEQNATETARWFQCIHPREATVQSCEAKKVAEMTGEQILMTGLTGIRQDCPECQKSGCDRHTRTPLDIELRNWWYVEHPTRPFESAWVWVAKLKREGR